MGSKPEPLEGKFQKVRRAGGFHWDKDIRSAVEWAEHEMLHTSRNHIDILYEAFEDVMG